MPRRLLVTVLLGLALAGCSPEELAEPLPPTDRFYFPIGIATSRVASGTALLVASSNFDLRYSASDGGTLLSLIDDGAPLEGALSPVSAERISSYAGPVAVTDPAACSQTTALVASRYADVLYRYTLGSDGSLTCGADCVIDLAGPASDPFAIGVACGSSSGRHAYVGFLDTPDTARSDGDSAWIAEVDLDAPAAPPRLLEIGDGPVRSMAYDPTGDRLWIAAKSSGERAMLYSVLLSDETWKTGSRPIEAVDGIDLFDFVRGLELRSLAVGTPVAGEPTRLYATARVYDVEAQAANRARPSSDVDGVLLVIDVTAIDGIPAVLSIRSISVGTGIGDVALVQRGAGVRDLVLVTALDGDLLWAWDAEAEAVAWYLGHDSFGLPLVGDRPTALSVVQAIDPTAVGASADVYVASFGDHRVSRVSLPIAGLSTKPSAIATIGGLAP